jgi:hypothetical protein
MTCGLCDPKRDMDTADREFENWLSQFRVVWEERLFKDQLRAAFMQGWYSRELCGDMLYVAKSA